MYFANSAPPVIQFGIETEIGIARDGEENLDVAAESIWNQVLTDSGAGASRNSPGRSSPRNGITSPCKAPSVR